MTFYEQDMNDTRLLSATLPELQERARQHRERLHALREAKRAMNEHRVMSYEEFLQSIRRAHGYNPDPEHAGIKKQYQLYQEDARKKTDELRLALESAHSKAHEGITHLKDAADAARRILKRIDTHAGELRTVAEHAERTLTLTSQQLTVDAIAALDRDLAQTSWFKDQFR